MTSSGDTGKQRSRLGYVSDVPRASVPTGAQAISSLVHSAARLFKSWPSTTVSVSDAARWNSMSLEFAGLVASTSRPRNPAIACTPRQLLSRSERDQGIEFAVDHQRPGIHLPQIGQVGCDQAAPDACPGSRPASERLDAWR